MFDKHAVDDYRSITAPDALRDRVFRAADKPKRLPARIVSVVGVIAACLVLLLTMTLRPHVQSDIVFSDDRSLSSTSTLNVPVSISARSNAAQYVAFTVSCEGSLTLDTDDSLFVCDEDGTFLSEFPYNTFGAVSVYWYINTPEASFTVNGVSYTLNADEDRGTFTIVQD